MAGQVPGASAAGGTGAPDGAGAPVGRGYPVTLLLTGRPCVVVGGGAVAGRKTAGLVAAGAVVTVVSPKVAPEIRALGVRVVERAFEPGDLEGAWLAVTATGVPAVDRAVFEAGERAGVLVNAADAPGACSVLLPAVLRRGPVSVAVSTDGRSPSLAVALRDAIAELVGPGVADVAEILGEARQALHARGRSTEGLPWRALAGDLLAAPVAGEGSLARREAVSRFLAEAAGVAP